MKVAAAKPATLIAAFWVSSMTNVDTGDQIEELAEQLLGLARPGLTDRAMEFINGDRAADDFPMMIDDIVQFTGLNAYPLTAEALAIIEQAVALLGPDDDNSQRIAGWLSKYHHHTSAA